MSFSFKAIPTRYNGYLFRSRLEARWATFFDALGISYEYEKEGFDLNGTRYLPDFWLPEWKCWVEIKGQEPTEEELRKAKLLALCTGHRVYIIVGIEFDETIPSPSIHVYYPPSLSLIQSDPRIQNPISEVREAPVHILVLLDALYEAHVQVTVEGPLDEDNSFFRDESPSLSFTQAPFCYGTGDIHNFIRRAAQQQAVLTRIAADIKQHEQELIAVLTPPKGWEIEFHEQIHFDGLEWAACTACGEICIAGCHGWPHRDCPETPSGQWVNNLPRLIEAIIAARSARFEFDGK